MIVDRLENYSCYLGINKGLEKGFEFINGFLRNELPDGRYELDGDRVYAMVQSYETKPESEKKWEAHRQYIDIQFVVRGKEVIGYAHLSQLKECNAYDPEKDFALLEGDEGIGVALEEGSFSIFFPQDGHKPGCVWDVPESVKKIVVKVKVN